MSAHIDLFYNTYANFTEQVLASVRAATFGEDIGQNSWVTTDEYRRFIGWLLLSPDSQVLEVASGSGGPALYLAGQTGCRVTGVDVNPNGVATANQAASRHAAGSRVTFEVADATAPLPFDDHQFDALLCILDVTENAAQVSLRWREARQRFRQDLLQIEGGERYEGVQKFLAAVHRLAHERRLSRVAYLVES